jgi:hypothetical protein
MPMKVRFIRKVHNEIQIDKTKKTIETVWDEQQDTNKNIERVQNKQENTNKQKKKN